LACAVAIQFLKVLDELLPHVREVSSYFHVELERLKTTHGGVREVRGLGLMLGLELDSVDTAKAVVSQLLRRGILINRTNETMLRFLPPYIIQEKHVDQVVRELDAALSASISKSKRGSKPAAALSLRSHN